MKQDSFFLRNTSQASLMANESERANPSYARLGYDTLDQALKVAKQHVIQHGGQVQIMALVRVVEAEPRVCVVEPM